MIGSRAYGQLIDVGIARAQELAAAVDQRAEFELAGQPTSNIVNYRYVTPQLRARARAGELSPADNAHLNDCNQRLQAMQAQRGRSFVSRTTIRHTRYGRDVPIVVLRAVLANPLTETSHIDEVLDEQLMLAQTL